MITSDIIQQIQTACSTTFCCNPTVTRIEEYHVDDLYAGTCEEVGHTDDWDWIDRVFLVYFTLHDYPAKGQSLPSHGVIALPKQEMQEINSFITGKPAPLAIYDITESKSISMLSAPQQNQSNKTEQ